MGLYDLFDNIKWAVVDKVDDIKDYMENTDTKEKLSDLAYNAKRIGGNVVRTGVSALESYATSHDSYGNQLSREEEAVKIARKYATGSAKEMLDACINEDGTVDTELAREIADYYR